jgi:Tfp pilus assembly protein PilF
MEQNTDLQAASIATPDGKGNLYQVLGVCGFLMVAVGLVFGQLAHYDFIDLDDTAYVYLNRHVTDGLTPEAVKWAFTHRYAGTYTPATWVTHMIDWQIYGSNAGGHHLTNVLLHAATAIFLFLMLRQMTGRLWPSALVAAIFAVHPLRVESVAWVTERKDVLSGLFFVLALWAYVGYVRHRFSILRYSAVLVLFVLGLMAKPMLVTLPFVLLLLDYWPLERLAAKSPLSSNRSVAMRLILEKLPFFAICVVFCVIAIWSYGSEGDDLLAQRYSLAWRLGNVPNSYVSYLGMFFYPVNLALPYPRPGLDLSYWKIFGAVLLLVSITLATVAGRRKYPYLLVGWLWYLGMLVPVSGLLQFGMQTMADRFTYLPQIGFCMALVWGGADVIKSWTHPRWVCGVVMGIILAGLMGLCWHQTSYWRNNETLWNHSLACTSRNSLAHQALGSFYLSHGQTDEAIEQYEITIAIEPDNEAHYNLAVILASKGRFDEAIEHYEKEIQYRPHHVAAHNNLGQALLYRGQFEKGLACCLDALRLDPDFAEAHFNVGNVYFFRNQTAEAIAEYRKAIESKPDLPEAHYHLGLALAKIGQPDNAIEEYRKALTPKTEITAEVHNILGLALLARGQSEEAMSEFQKALEIAPNFNEARYNLNKVRAGKKQAR